MAMIYIPKSRFELWLTTECYLQYKWVTTVLPFSENYLCTCILYTMRSKNFKIEELKNKPYHVTKTVNYRNQRSISKWLTNWSIAMWALRNFTASSNRINKKFFMHNSGVNRDENFRALGTCPTMSNWYCQLCLR